MGQPTVFVPIALALFVPATWWAFSRLGPTRGMIASVLGGWMFLPCYDTVYDVPVLRGKYMFIGAVVLATSFFVDGQRWSRLKLGWVDLPVAAAVVVAFATSVVNGLGAMDGFHEARSVLLGWASFYVLARLYLGDPRGVRRLAHGLVVAGLAYVPFALWEIRMSPHLHAMVYGFSTFGFADSYRLGGFRPAVFMTHGLMLSMFLAAATLTAYWLWRTGAALRIIGWPAGAVFGLLFATTLLCKSAGAMVLLLAGMGVLELTRRTRHAWPVVVLSTLPLLYCVARCNGWGGRDLVALSERYINRDRAWSLNFRMKNEDLLIERALERPWLGWGGWGRSRVHTEEGRDVVITDGMWVISLGTNGILGLAALLLTLAAPALLLLRRFPARHWGDPRLASAAALACIGLLWSIDNLFNAMMGPVLPAAGGALVSLATARRRARAHPPGTATASAPGPDPATPHEHAY